MKGGTLSNDLAVLSTTLFWRHVACIGLPSANREAVIPIIGGIKKLRIIFLRIVEHFFGKIVDGPCNPVAVHAADQSTINIAAFPHQMDIAEQRGKVHIGQKAQSCEAKVAVHTSIYQLWQVQCLFLGGEEISIKCVGLRLDFCQRLGLQLGCAAAHLTFVDIDIGIGALGR